MADEPDDFRFSTMISLRYRDLDTLEHVNNASYATFLEQARLEYYETVLGDDFSDSGVVLAHLELDFRGEVYLADGSVTVELRTTALGKASTTTAYRVTTGEDDRLVLTGESVQVSVGEDGTQPLPPDWRDAITAYEPGL